jgi:hypothetical protein
MTSASLPARAHDEVVDEPDPAARPRQRSFTAEYKARIVEEYDALPAGSAERDALLRREGLYPTEDRPEPPPVEDLARRRRLDHQPDASWSVVMVYSIHAEAPDYSLGTDRGSGLGGGGAGECGELVGEEPDGPGG